MSGESSKVWRCPSCGRLLIERSIDYARQRHQAVLAQTRCGTSEFARETTWPAYLASLRRCRCGSKRALKPAAMSGQLELQADPVVLQ